jgi:regulator of replication initiation timing
MKLKIFPQKFVLVAITIILMGSFAANVYFYSQKGVFAADSTLQEQVGNFRSQLANLTNQASSLQDENANLTTHIIDHEGQAVDLRNQKGSLQGENSILLGENVDLQSQLNLLTQGKIPAKIVTRLVANDMRYNYSGQDIRLYITGEVWNVGTETALNCSLHVKLYQGTTVAADMYLPLGDIAGGSFVDVGRNIYYIGGALTNWTIIPEYN